MSYGDTEYELAWSLLKHVPMAPPERLLYVLVDMTVKRKLTKAQVASISGLRPHEQIAILGQEMWSLSVHVKGAVAMEAAMDHVKECEERVHGLIEQLADMRARLELARDTIAAAHPDVMTSGLAAVLTPPPITRSKQ